MGPHRSVKGRNPGVKNIFFLGIFKLIQVRRAHRYAGKSEWLVKGSTLKSTLETGLGLSMKKMILRSLYLFGIPVRIWKKWTFKGNPLCRNVAAKRHSAILRKDNAHAWRKEIRGTILCKCSGCLNTGEKRVPTPLQEVNDSPAEEKMSSSSSSPSSSEADVISDFDLAVLNDLDGMNDLSDLENWWYATLTYFSKVFILTCYVIFVIIPNMQNYHRNLGCRTAKIKTVIFCIFHNFVCSFFFTSACFPHSLPYGISSSLIFVYY